MDFKEQERQRVLLCVKKAQAMFAEERKQKQIEENRRIKQLFEGLGGNENER